MTKCRCYINVKYYARQANKGGNMKGYKPCPIHEIENKCQHKVTIAINEEGYAGIYCVDCDEQLEKEC